MWQNKFFLHSFLYNIKGLQYKSRCGFDGAIKCKQLTKKTSSLGLKSKLTCYVLANRMAVLLSHLLLWQYQPERQSGSWQRTIKEQRKAIARRIKNTPNLKTSLNDPEWFEDAWGDAVSMTIIETGISSFPEVCLWTVENIMSDIGLPLPGDTDKKS